MVMKAKVVFLEFQKEGKNFFPVEPGKNYFSMMWN